ncbi:MAG: penicillin-binding protein 2 [Candidatus Baltobacteraceae bacterium]
MKDTGIWLRQRFERPARRLAGFAAFAVLIFAVLIGRLIDVQIVHGSEYRAQAEANQIRLIRVAAPRGLIVDRHGKVMVRSRPSFVVALVPSLVKHLHRELESVATTIHVAPAKLEERLYHHNGVNYRTFAEVQTYEPYGPVVLARNLSVADVARLSELLTDLPGVDIEVQAIRDYPYNKVGSLMLGYVGLITASEYKRLRPYGYSPNAIVGKDGLEYEYDRYLRGRPGGQRVVVDAAGNVVAGDHLPDKAPVPGDTLQLAVSLRLERIVESALAHGVARVQRGESVSGAVVVEDPWTGRILAMSSYPDYNPNDFALDRSRKISFYLTDPAQPLFNRAIAAATPTGSTFKMVTGSAAITVGVIRPNQVVYDNGAWNCDGYIARDIVSGGLGYTTFVPALAASSDGYFYRLSMGLGLKRLRKFALLYGLDARTGIDLPGESKGNWPTNAWMMKNYGVPQEPSDACFLGIGQGAMQATPLQIANIASAVVNGGTLYHPHIVTRILTPDGRTIKVFPPTIIRHVPVTQKSLAAVRAGMAQVTSAVGTAYGLAIPGFPFAGKTGTVETDGGNGPNTTWFVCWAPLKHPKIVIAVYVDRSGGYGANVAAPIARKIMIRYFRLKV